MIRLWLPEKELRMSLLTDPAERFAAVRQWIAEAPADATPPDALAAAVVAAQVAAIPAWTRLQSSGFGHVDPQMVRPFPAELYKRDGVVPAPAEVCWFESSGTTGGRPGRVPCSPRDLELMDLAIRVNAARFLFPDGANRTQIHVLAPSPDLRPGMIMAWGMARLIQQFGREGSRFWVGPEGLDAPGLRQALQAAADAGTPVTLIGATFGFVALFDAWSAASRHFALPPGSRLMDAGGTKGRSRAIGRDEFEAVAASCFGIEPDWQTNLLGMTEADSQFYDHVVGTARPTLAAKRNPPWTQTFVVDPFDLQAVPDGEAGLLVHLDLANFDHPAWFLTQDVGRRVPGGFVIEGRAEGADLRGCSLSLEAFLAAGPGGT